MSKKKVVAKGEERQVVCLTKGKCDHKKIGNICGFGLYCYAQSLAYVKSR